MVKRARVGYNVRQDYVEVFVANGEFLKMYTGVGGLVNVDSSHALLVNLTMYDNLAGMMLSLIMDKMDGHGEWVVTARELSLRLGRGVHAIYRKLKRLEDLHFVQVLRRGRSGIGMVIVVNPYFVNRSKRGFQHNFDSRGDKAVVSIERIRRYYEELRPVKEGGRVVEQIDIKTGEIYE